MIRSGIYFGLLVMLLGQPGGALSQELGELNLKVSRLVMAQGITKKEPVKPGSRFTTDVGKIFCFSHIMGAEQEELVSHRWILDGRRILEVDLRVGSRSWRTWSKKTIRPYHAGAWKVQVLNEIGEVLREISFHVDPSDSTETATE